MSISWHLDAEPRPAILVLPPAAASLDEAHAAIELWEHYSRKALDPSQRLTVEVMMAQAVDGRWAASTTGREMSRQNGKGDEIEVPELWGLVQRAEAILHTVHDAVLLATQAQQRLLGVLESHGDLRRLVKRKWLGTGQQMIEMRNGGVIWYRTRTGGGGRGVDDISRLVVDEAQHATAEQMAAVTPTLLANENPQMNVLGTAGIAGKSAWWWGVRRRALSAQPGEFGYVGHTAESVRLDGVGHVVQDAVEVADRSLWPAANPSVLAGRGGGMAFLEEQLQRLGPEKFGREHLCIWDADLGVGGELVIPYDRWTACEDQTSTVAAPRVFAVDVSPERHAAVAVAGVRSDGTPHVEIAQVEEWERGTGWLPQYLLSLRVKYPDARIVGDPTGPAGSVFTDAKALGLEIEPVAGRDYAQACASFKDAVVEGRMRHRPDPVLDAALLGASKRDVGDGAWTWSRKSSFVNIAPLIAATLALSVVTEPAAPIFAY